MDEQQALMLAFLDETVGQLGALEACVAELERDPKRAQAIPAAQCAMQSIQGGAARFGLAVMADLAQLAECLLADLRHAHRAASATEIDALSETMDAFHGQVEALRRDESPERGAPQRAIERLSHLRAATEPVICHVPGEFAEFAEFAELAAAGEGHPRFAPPVPGDAEGFGFFVPLHADEPAAPAAEFLIGPGHEAAEFFVVMAGQVEAGTGLPVLTRMPAIPAAVREPPGSAPAIPPSDSRAAAVVACTALAAAEARAAAGRNPAAELPRAAAAIWLAAEQVDRLLDLAGAFSELRGLFEEALNHDFVARERADPALRQFARLTRDLHSAVGDLLLMPGSTAPREATPVNAARDAAGHPGAPPV
jgi:chemotaxis protein histidine kinase CheA